MKNKALYGLLAFPVAVIGILVGVAHAENSGQQPVPSTNTASVQTSAAVKSEIDTDMETDDDQEITIKSGAELEVNDKEANDDNGQVSDHQDAPDNHQDGETNDGPDSQD